MEWSSPPTEDRPFRAQFGPPFAVVQNAMSDWQIDDKTRELMDKIDRHLRDAERLRSYVARRSHVWPERRQHSRIPEVHQDDSGARNEGDAAR